MKTFAIITPGVPPEIRLYRAENTYNIGEYLERRTLVKRIKAKTERTITTFTHPDNPNKTIALAIDVSHEKDEWKRKHRGPIHTIIDHGVVWFSNG